jgi:hypothetical protein
MSSESHALEKSKMTKPSKEQDIIRLWSILAQIHGYNQMALQATSLGERIFCRLARDKAESLYEQMSGTKIVHNNDNPTILVLPYSEPKLELKASDVELMRKYVNDFDREVKNG